MQYLQPEGEAFGLSLECSGSVRRPEGEDGGLVKQNGTVYGGGNPRENGPKRRDQRVDLC